jgi:uncharacterized protein YacL
MTGEREEVLILKMSLCVIISATNVKTFSKRKTFCVIFFKKRKQRKEKVKERKKRSKRKKEKVVYTSVYI